MVCLCNAIPHDSDDAVLPQGLDGSERHPDPIWILKGQGLELERTFQERSTDMTCYCMVYCANAAAFLGITVPLSRTRGALLLRVSDT